MPTMDSSDNQWELDKAVRAQRPASRNVSSAAVNLHPISLVRRRGPERDDIVTLTTVEPNPPRPDGTTEAAGVTVRTFKNGEFVGGQIPPEVTAFAGPARSPRQRQTASRSRGNVFRSRSNHRGRCSASYIRAPRLGQTSEGSVARQLSGTAPRSVRGTSIDK
jgi:hypothetical protein